MQWSEERYEEERRSLELDEWRERVAEERDWEDEEE